MSTILPVYLSEDLSEENLIDISIYITESSDSYNNLNLLVDKRTPRIIFKIKKYYIIYV